MFCILIKKTDLKYSGLQFIKLYQNSKKLVALFYCKRIIIGTDIVAAKYNIKV